MSIELVDPKLCNGCGICINSCPLDVIRLDTLVSDKKEYSWCQLGCPAGVDMRRYIYYLRTGALDKAIEVLRESLPLPAITGRVCPHPCETECARKDVDEAININSLERFVADYWLEEKARPVRRIYAARTAIIGSGPAGLACAYFLARMGYPVTVFEAMPVIGGMLKYGIPEYRLPRDLLEAQINYIRDIGVEFKTGITIGKDISLEKIREDYQTVFFAIGNQLSRKLEIKGAQLKGALNGLDFLRGINLKKPARIKNRVVVIGGGNVAVDVALSALRSGAKKVQLACLESEDKIPAFNEEIQQARDEGVIIHTSWGPKEILGDGKKITGIELVRCTRVFDQKDQFNPSYDEQVTKTLPADNVILAIGQAPDPSMIPEGIKVTRGGTIEVDPITLETDISGVFAGGDIICGTASVIEAIAAGRTAAVSIDRYNKGEDLKAGRYLKPDKVKKPPQEGIPKMRRQITPLLPVDQRKNNFKEIKHGLDEVSADLEAQRCMTCGSRAVISYVDDCQLCLFCERDCPQKAIYISPDKKISPLLAWG